MCPLLAPVFQGFVFLLRPLTVLMKQTRQVVCAIKQYILLNMSMKRTIYKNSIINIVQESIYNYIYWSNASDRLFNSIINS